MRPHLIAACVLLTVVSVSGQTRWTPSRTAWGDPDLQGITYQVTIDDPATFTRPWTLGVPFKQDKEQAQLFEYACHEGNYAMRNILSGARADERAR